MIPHGLSARGLAELPVPEGAEAGMSPLFLPLPSTIMPVL